MLASVSFYGVFFLALNVPTGAFILDVAQAPRNVVHQVFVSNGGSYGNWGPKQFCPDGVYANGYSLKIEGDQGDGDDTALNGVFLSCGDGSGSSRWISSTVGQWGSERAGATCPNHQFLVAFKMNVESAQGFGDDTAANDIQFQCRGYAGGNTTNIDSHPATPHYGTWGAWSAPCPVNSAICGLSTRVEGSQDAGFIHRDDSSLNDVVLFCCDNST